MFYLLHISEFPPSKLVRFFWPLVRDSFQLGRVSITQCHALLRVIVVEGEVGTTKDIQGLCIITQIFPSITFVHYKGANVDNNWSWILRRHAVRCAVLKG